MTEKHYDLEIHPGGKVVYNEWVYDEIAGEGEYIQRPLHGPLAWMHKRDHTCKVVPGVVLLDIFKIVADEPEIADIMFCNCFIKEYIDHWNTLGVIPPAPEYSDSALEYLELYWSPELNFDDHGFSELWGDNRACFHGIGFELREDKYEDWCEEGKPAWKKGDRISWAVEFTPIAELLSIPIKLNESFVILDDWEKHRDKMPDIPKLIDSSKRFTLHQIIEGVFWELSFVGCEEEKAEKLEELNTRVEEVKSGKAKLIPIDQLLNDGYINDGFYRSEN